MIGPLETSEAEHRAIGSRAALGPLRIPGHEPELD